MAAHGHFNMSAISATVAIRRYIADYPDATAEEAATSVRRLDTDLAAHDFAGGLEIHSLLPAELSFADTASDIRSTLSRLIAHHRPWWIRGVPYGRERFATMIDQDEAQCFRAAGLMKEPATDDVVAWWDHLAQAVRTELDDRLLQQGREAERLSLAYEHERLACLGIARTPRWVAVEDNWAGYDILSFAPGPAQPVNRLIEVKSSTQDPPRIILTRKEWEAAMRYGEAYVFHVWRLPTRDLIERTVSEIKVHVPAERGDGRWRELEIPLR
jgi:hypothetical protein